MQQIETIQRPGLVTESATLGANTSSVILVAADATDRRIYVTGLTVYQPQTTANGLTLRSGTVTIAYIGFSSASTLEQHKSFSGAAGEPILVASAGSALYGAASVATLNIGVTYYYD